MLKRACARALAFWKKWMKWPAVIMASVVILIGTVMVIALVLAIGSTSFYHVFFADKLGFFVDTPLRNYMHFDGFEVYVYGWTAAAILALLAAGLVYWVGTVAHRRVQHARERKRSAEEEKTQAAAALKHQELAREREMGRVDGVYAERAIVRKALLHALKPKMLLPEVQDGYIRLFWINVTNDGPIARPTADRSVHHTVTAGTKPPSGIIGAPFYSQVKSTGRDELAIMGVVYTLDIGSTDWS